MFLSQADGSYLSLNQLIAVMEDNKHLNVSSTGVNPEACARARGLTSLPYIMRWWVVMSALKTTIQLLLEVRSSSVSARWGMLTFSSLVQ